jgi:hypothetical protein
VKKCSGETWLRTFLLTRDLMMMMAMKFIFKLLLVMVNFYIGTIEHFCPYKPWLKPKPSPAEL